MKIIQKSNIFLVITIVIVGVSVALTFIFGLKLGIDFTGGSLLEISFKNERPKTTEIKEALKDVEGGVSQTQTAGGNDMIIRMKDLSEDSHQAVLENLNKNFGEIEEKRFETIGPTIGNELKRKAIIALAVVLVSIVLYLAYAFRKVSTEVSSWKFGVCAILALAHDLAVTVGAFAILGKYFNVEIDTLFVTALLTILGFSVHDTIVVFDRIRYNLIKQGSSRDFTELVNKSVNQTLARSLNTSATTLIVLVVLYLFGGASVQWFVFALIIGIISGTYSSIFVASPILVFWQKYSKK